jgi:DNA-binding transcriptional LysR family regulator
MTLELRVLRYFLAVADRGSITAASRQVHVAQPSLSRQLRALEAELGIELFVRDGRALRLGPAGRRLLPIARDLVARADTANATMTALGRGSAMPLTVAAPPATIADVIAPFVASHPARTTPTFVAADADAAYRALARGEVDLALAADAPPRGVALAEVARFPVWAQVAPTHPWAELGEVTLELLLQQPLILVDNSFATRRSFDAEVARTGAAYELVAEVTVPEIAQALAAAGRGVAIVSYDAKYGLRSVPIACAHGPLRIALHAAWNPTHYAVGAIRELVDALTRFCAAPA